MSLRQLNHVMAGAAGFLALCGLGALLMPAVFWDGFLFPYIIGPVMADAGGESGGATATYNWVSTAAYSVVLAFAVLYLYTYFTEKKISLGPKYIFALIPMILLGSVLRALEDAELFLEPVQYLFISPNIYIVIGFLTIGLTVFGSRLEKMDKTAGWKYLVIATAVFAAVLTGLYYGMLDCFALHHVTTYPFFILAALGVHYALSRRYLDGAIKLPWVILQFSSALLLGSAYLTALWPRSEQWLDHYIEVTGKTASEVEGGLNPEAYLYVSLLALGFLGIVLLVGKLVGERGKAFFLPTNIMLAFAQLWDGAATSLGIGEYGYIEKHVVPSLLIELTGTSYVMMVLKAAVVFLVILTVDVFFKDEFKDERLMVDLLKISVIVLGLAPGTRDVLRIAMGV